MERNNDEIRRGRERYEPRSDERSERRWERGEIGEAHTGAPERFDDYGERRWERERAYPDDWRRDDRREPWYPHRDENAQTWSRSAAPERPSWRRSGYETEPRRPDLYRGQDPRPARPYEEGPRPLDPPHGYRVGADADPRTEERVRNWNWWGPMAGRGRPPRDYRRADDRIRDEICERIVRYSDIDASDVEIQVVAGDVTLVGTVEDRGSKRDLEDLVEHVFGVSDVHNNLKVRKSAWRQIGERLFGTEEENRSQEPERPKPKA
jgi:hypothetical protein